MPMILVIWINLRNFSFVYELCKIHTTYLAVHAYPPKPYSARFSSKHKAGDTLFVGGCGRFFDGPAYTSAFETMQKLKQLDQDTLVFCAHEYTQQNLRFVQDMVNERQVVDWVSQPTVNYLADTVAEQRKDKQPTVPSTIGIESEINPFLMASTVDDFALVRDARDNF
eukprot:m.72785 g.72785  ORF g.72785 m.72785 type:complete len:168 (-) comp12342_c0_seq7:2899-3402(-)